MNIRESLNIAFDSIRANKMRSILTTIGIVIGVTTIIGMMSLIQGLQDYMARQLSVLGTNTFQIQKDPAIQMGHSDPQYRNRKDITLEQAEAIKKYATLVKAVGPETYSWGEVVRYMDKKTNPNVVVLGVTPEFQEANNYFVDEGRFLSQLDVDNNRNVVVLGLDIVETLFPHASPIGQTVRIGGDRFDVVGTLEKQGSGFGQSRDNRVVLPISTFHKLYGKRRSLMITVQVYDPVQMQDAIEQTSAILRIVRKVPPGKPNDFEIFTSETLLATFNDLTKYIKIAAVGIAMISLIVGGIGIMNIMLVSVTERTREIGIRKSMGAKRRDILWQFMIEAVILGNVGGLIGIFLGILIGILVGALSPLPTAIPIQAVILGITFCSLIGLFFGIFPAARAAKLDPVVALRYE